MRKLFLFLCAALMSAGMFADINLTITQKPTESYSPGDDWVELSMHSEEGVDVTLYLAGITEMALGTSYNLGDMDSWSKISISGTDYELSDALITKTMNDGLVRYAGFVADYNSNRYNFDYQEQPAPEPAEVTVVFAANDKTVERTVTLPHTFKCDWAGGMERPDELDIIIHELYNDYYYCNSNMNASGSDQVEAGTEEDPKNDYITIKGVFEGTATVTGDYLDYIAGDYGEHNYSITISIKGDEPQSQETVVTITEADYVSGNTITKNGVTLTANQIYGVGSWYVEGPGTFTNTIGNFTKIEVTTVGGTVFIEGDGWTGDWDKKTWTGNAPSVSFVEDIMGKGEGFSIVCTIESQGEPTGVENVQTNQVQATKILRDGMLLIEKNGKLFNVTGAQVR